LEEPKLTHKGWLLFCPIYLADVDTDCPYIIPRHWILNPLCWLAEKVQSLVITLCCLFDEDYEPQFYFLITGEL